MDTWLGSYLATDDVPPQISEASAAYDSSIPFHCSIPPFHSTDSRVPTHYGTAAAYCIVGKFGGEFGKSSVIFQTKSI